MIQKMKLLEEKIEKHFETSSRSTHYNAILLELRSKISNMKMSICEGFPQIFHWSTWNKDLSKDTLLMVVRAARDNFFKCNGLEKPSYFLRFFNRFYTQNLDKKKQANQFVTDFKKLIESEEFTVEQCHAFIEDRLVRNTCSEHSFEATLAKFFGDQFGFVLSPEKRSELSATGLKKEEQYKYQVLRVSS